MYIDVLKQHGGSKNTKVETPETIERRNSG